MRIPGLFAVLVLVPAATSLPPSIPMQGTSPDLRAQQDCLTLGLWDSAERTCLPSLLCDVGRPCTCGATDEQRDANGLEALRLNKGGKACQQGAWCDCSGAGAEVGVPGKEGVCSPLKASGGTCASSAECLTGQCLAAGNGTLGRCGSPGQLNCGATGYKCGEGLFCSGNATCERRKGVQEECVASDECRGGLACLRAGAGGGLSCQPLFGRGYNQPCGAEFGECSWGMQCVGGRCAIYNSNEARNCSVGGDAVCEPYGVCQCSGRGGGVCAPVVNTQCERQWELLVKCLAVNNCPLHDVNYTAIATRPSACISERCAGEWTVAQCCTVEGFEGFFASRGSTLLGAGCANGVPVGAGLFVVACMMVLCSTISYAVHRRHSGGRPVGGSYVRVSTEELDVDDDYEDSRGYSVLTGAHERSLFTQRGAELTGQTLTGQMSGARLAKIEDPPEAGGGGFVQGQAGCFSDL